MKKKQKKMVQVFAGITFTNTEIKKQKRIPDEIIIWSVNDLF